MNRLELKPRCLQGLFDIHSGSLGGRDHWFALLQGSSISSPEVELCFISRNFHGQQHGKTRVVHHNKQSQPESENAEKHWTWQEIEDLNNMFQLDCLYFCCSICHISAIFLPCSICRGLVVAAKPMWMRSLGWYIWNPQNRCRTPVKHSKTPSEGILWDGKHQWYIWYMMIFSDTYWWYIDEMVYVEILLNVLPIRKSGTWRVVVFPAGSSSGRLAPNSDTGFVAAKSTRPMSSPENLGQLRWPTVMMTWFEADVPTEFVFQVFGYSDVISCLLADITCITWFVCIQYIYIYVYIYVYIYICIYIYMYIYIYIYIHINIMSRFPWQNPCLGHLPVIPPWQGNSHKSSQASGRRAQSESGSQGCRISVENKTLVDTQQNWSNLT